MLLLLAPGPRRALLCCCAVFWAVCIAPSRSLDNGLARLPPMGWSTFNAFHRDWNESVFKANVAVSLGLRRTA